MKKAETVRAAAVLFLALLFLCGLIPVAAQAEAVQYSVSSAADLSAAATAINTAGAGDYVINVVGDVTSNGGVAFNGAGVNVTVIGNGHTLTVTPGSAFQVRDGATLTLGDGISELTVRGGDDNDEPGIVYVVGSSCTLNMYDKVTLRDHKGLNYFGGGVTVEGGTFNMYGGTIENCGIDGGSVCYGGGVAVFNNGTFNMSGGTIRDCYVTTTYNASKWQTPSNAGGGVFVCGSTFNMTDGTIENCTAATDGGGVAVVTSLDAYFDNGGYGNLDSKFTMTNGTITGCEAGLVGGGIFVGGGYVDYSAICASTPAASGSMSDPGVYISGGTVSNNEAINGGGIFLNWIRPTRPVQLHNVSVTGNTAEEGAGINVFSYWTNTDIDNATITGNTATGSGGGIALLGNSSGGETFLKNSTVENNTSGDRGAGVYYDENSKLTISGADVIRNNKYNGEQNNLNIYSLEKPVYVNGALTGSQIGLSDPLLWDDGLSDEDLAALSTACLTSGYKDHNTEPPSAYFTSDHNTWVGSYSLTNTNEVMLVRAPYEYIETVDVTKTYRAMTGYNDAGGVVAPSGLFTEDVTFTVTPYTSFNRAGGKTAIPSFSETSYTISVGSGTDAVTVTLPDFSGADYGIGDYWYQLSETAGSTAGVKYDSNTYYLHLTVSYADVYQPARLGVSQVALHKAAPAADGRYTNSATDKVTGFTNEYGAGTLTVRKELTGSMADKTKTFTATVTFNAPAGKTVRGPITYGTNTIAPGWTGSKSVDLTLEMGSFVVFENLPDGVTYTVAEADYSADGYDVPEYSFDNASETGDAAVNDPASWTNSKANGTVSDSADTVTVRNNKDVVVDVGVILENAPFAILFVLAAVGVIVLPLCRRRKA